MAKPYAFYDILSPNVPTRKRTLAAGREYPRLPVLQVEDAPVVVLNASNALPLG
jgi:hypothetical protein